MSNKYRIQRKTAGQEVAEVPVGGEAAGEVQPAAPAAAPVDAETFIKGASTAVSQSSTLPLKPKRLNVDFEPDVYKRIKSHVLSLDMTMADYIKGLIRRDIGA